MLFLNIKGKKKKNATTTTCTYNNNTIKGADLDTWGDLDQT